MAATRGVIPRLSQGRSALFLCDIQEKFRPHIVHFDEIAQISKRLLDAAGLLNMKVLATEHYPKGLGRTIAELEVEKYKVPIFEKVKFSMCLPPVLEEFGTQHDSIILCGIEAHVCVLHTAFDFLERGVQVHVVADAVSSRANVDRFFALRQLERAGAVITTSECVILGLLGGADHPKFKEVQKLIKTSAPDTGLLTDFLR